MPFADIQWPLEAQTARDWIGAIAWDFDGLAGVFPGLIGDEQLDLMVELTTSDPGIMSRWGQCAEEAVQQASGRDWWWAKNLCHKSIQGWTMINGFLVRQGVVAASLTFPDWLDACYTFLWERGDDNGRAALDLELSMPPKGRPLKQSPEQVKTMLAQFAAD